MDNARPFRSSKHPMARLSPIEVSKEEVGPCHFKLAIQVPADRIAQSFDLTYRAAGSDMRIPGFRKGKAPAAILRTLLGDQVAEDAKSHLLESVVREGVQRSELIALRVVNFDADAIEVDEESPLSFEVEVETTPQVELPPWEEITVQPDPVIINADQVEEALESLRQREMQFEDAAEGQGLDSEHAVEMDLVYLKDEEEGPAAEDIRLGLESPLYGVEEEDWAREMDGVLPDATVDLPCSFNEGFSNEDWVGEKGIVRLSVKRVVKPRPATDAEIAAAGDIDVDELPTRIKDSLTAEAERSERNRQADAVLQQIQDKRPFQLPDGMIQEEAEQSMKGQVKDMVERGLDEEEAQKEVEQQRTRFLESAEVRLKSYFLIRRIAEQEKLKVTRNELSQAFRAIASQHGVDAKTVEKVYTENGRVDDLSSDILTGKVRAFLNEKVAEMAPAVEQAEA